MKKSKLLLLTLAITLLLTGCFKRDNMDNISIYTTTYPIEYLVNYIYGYNSNINSIYPKGVKISEYKLTDKKIKEYAQTDMFIYNGLTNEKTTAASFLNKNHHLKVIDVSKGLSIKRDEELIKWFRKEYSYLDSYDTIEVLYHNTDFGVGD